MRSPAAYRNAISPFVDTTPPRPKPSAPNRIIAADPHKKHATRKSMPSKERLPNMRCFRQDEYPAEGKAAPGIETIRAIGNYRRDRKRSAPNNPRRSSLGGLNQNIRFDCLPPLEVQN